jgi:hypothetical protein
MSTLNNKLHVMSELTAVDNELIPLKEVAMRELASIYGLTGMVYTPHIDAYMQVCIKKAAILACLKNQKIIPLSNVELVSASLDDLYPRAKNQMIVEYKGEQYKRLFLPLKLSKSGKIVRKWARVWLLQQPNGATDVHWDSEIREIWPSYFLIRTTDF